MFLYRVRLLMVAAALLAICGQRGSAAQATIIGGATTLLNQADADQIADWLGEGNITLSKIFTKSTAVITPGLTWAEAFHAAADGRGRTISLIRALPLSNGPGWDIPAEQTIGGYNPLSWSSVGTYNVSGTQRDAFIFNLNSSVVQRQNVTSPGQIQTNNVSSVGPFFCGGPDFFAYPNGTYNGSVSCVGDCGISLNYSYGGTSYRTNIFGNDYAVTGNYSFYGVGEVEVFTVNASAVPEPGFWLPLAGMMGVLGVVVRRRRKQSTAEQS